MHRRPRRNDKLSIVMLFTDDHPLGAVRLHQLGVAPPTLSTARQNVSALAAAFNFVEQKSAIARATTLSGSCTFTRTPQGGELIISNAPKPIHPDQRATPGFDATTIRTHFIGAIAVSTATIINSLLLLLPALLGVLIPASMVLGLIFYVRHLNRKAGSVPEPARDPRLASTSTNSNDPYAPQNLPRPSDEVLARIHAGAILEAARMYKLETNLGLLECKRVIHYYANH